MRSLILDTTSQEQADRVREYAEANPYRPGRGVPTPGDNPHFVAHFRIGFRAVFTITQMEDKSFRHMSVSVPGSGYPNPFAVWSIAELFGFTGWDGKSEPVPAGWHVAMNEIEHCITVVQALPPETKH